MTDSPITADTLRDAEDARDRAREGLDDPVATRRVCVVRVGTTWLALDATLVNEITRVAQPLMAVPGAPKHVPGLMVLRGRPLALLDLRRFLELPPATDDVVELEARVVVVTVGAMRVGCVCDRVAGIAIIGEPSLRLPEAVVGRRLAPHALYTFDREEALVVLVDLGSLLAAARAS